jgi:hypothetical protein
MVDDMLKRISKAHQRSLAVEEATRERDRCRDKLFEDLYGIYIEVRELHHRDKQKVLNKPGHGWFWKHRLSLDVMQRVCPELHANERSKYAAVLRFAAKNNLPKSKIGSFIRENGGIKGCFKKEKALREKVRRKASKA